jgi:hypothetical protein
MGKNFLRYDDVLDIMNNNKEHPYSSDVMNKIFHVVRCCYLAFNNSSKISTENYEGGEILNYQGMSGKKTRHLYNNLMEFPNTKYLEIGTWYGSSSISAVYKNKLDALFIDNWSQFNGDKKIFQEAISKYLTKDSNCKLLESDCWKVNLNKIPNDFNIYLYDAGHEEEDHCKALTYYYNNLQDNFIFIVDDWCWGDVRDGTWRGIKEMDLKVRFCHEIFVSEEEKNGFPNHSGKHTWWNGVAIFVLEK